MTYFNKEIVSTLLQVGYCITICCTLSKITEAALDCKVSLDDLRASKLNALRIVKTIGLVFAITAAVVSIVMSQVILYKLVVETFIRFIRATTNM